jgi:hypothetical protein
MLIDTGADRTCLPGDLATRLGHNNDHKDVQRDTIHGIGGSSIVYLHSVQLCLLDPRKSTAKGSVVAWECPLKTTAFVKDLESDFGLIGTDIICQWKSLSFEHRRAGLTIRIMI